MSLYAVIMAGGVGSRFWPRSRQESPKQFLDVFEQASLIQNTFARLQPLVPAERCYVVTNERYVAQTRSTSPPCRRRTSSPSRPAATPPRRIAFAAAHLHALDPDATMVVLPADHVIRNVAAFHDVLRAAIEKAAEPDALVTIGIEPTHPETGYGYIQFASAATEDGTSPSAYPVRTFAEKPDLATAERFLDSGDFLWNSGMFIWRADSILRQLQRHLPDVCAAFTPIEAAIGRGRGRARRGGQRGLPPHAEESPSTTA